MKRIEGKEILDFLNKNYDKIVVKCEGNFSEPILGFCSLNNPKSDCITWIKNTDVSSLSCFDNFKNNVVICRNVVPSTISNPRYILTDHPKQVFFDILGYFYSQKNDRVIASDAIIETDQIGKNVAIGHHSYICKDVIIGDDTVIGDNVSITCPTRIGNQCVISSGVRIGTDGFGYYVVDEIPTKVAHFGGVSIGNKVEIGANTCIDRGTIDDTVIMDNVKIDNLIHIAHNCVIEENVMMSACSVACGSAHLCRCVYVAPKAVIKNQITMHENSFAGLGAVVTKDVEANMVVTGVPASVMREVRRGDK